MDAANNQYQSDTTSTVVKRRWASLSGAIPISARALLFYNNYF